MEAIEFFAKIEDGKVVIPKKILELQRNMKARFIVILDKEVQTNDDVQNKKMSAISLKTKNIMLDRDSANER